MKINQNIDEYDVGSLSAISTTVGDISKKCKILSQIATTMKHNVGIAQRDFTSENMARTQEVLKKYMKRLEEAQVELKELLDSVNEFSEKLRHAWRNW